MQTLVLDLTDEEDSRIKSLAASAGLPLRDFVISTLTGRANGAVDETDYLLSTPTMRQRLLDAIERPSAERITFNNTQEVAHALGV